MAMVVCGVALGASAQTTHRAANGAELSLPQIASLDCAAMGRVLREIDESGYRAGGPDTTAPGDQALLAYEDSLSERYFDECVSGGAAGARAFSSGFGD